MIKKPWLLSILVINSLTIYSLNFNNYNQIFNKQLNEKQLQNNVKNNQKLSLKTNSKIPDSLLLSNSAVLGIIEEHFDKVFNYAEHKLSTTMRVWSVYEKINQMILSVLSRKYFTILKIKVLGDNDDFIINNSRLIPTGDWFDIKFEMGRSSRIVRFKIKNVGAPELDDLDKIEEYFKNPIDYKFHKFTIKNHRLDGFDFIKKTIIEKIKINNKFIVYFDNLNKDENIVNDSPLVAHGDWFEGQVQINHFFRKITFKFKNVGFPEYSLFDAINQHFTKNFSFEKHHLTTGNFRTSALSIFKKNLQEIVEIQTIKLLKFELLNYEGYVINNSKIVPYGDYFDFTITWNNKQTTVRFKTKNVGYPELDLIDKIEDQFNTIFDGSIHNFDNRTRYWQVELFVTKMLRNWFLYNDFLQMKFEIIGDKNSLVIDNNPKALYQNGDLLNFNFQVNKMSRKLTLKVKNVLNILDLIDDYFYYDIDYSVHKLSIANTEADVITKFKEIVENLIGKQHFNDLKIEMFDLDNKIIGTKSDVVMNGIQFKFIVEFYEIKLPILFKMKDIYNPLNTIADYFEQVFDFDVHMFNTNQPRMSAFLKAVDLIYKLVGAEIYKQIEFYFYNREGNIIKNSPLIPTGDYFDIDLVIGYYKKQIRFKVKNVGEFDNFILNKIEQHFEQKFDYKVHKLNINSQLWEVYWLFRKIIVNLIGVNEVNTIKFDLPENMNNLIVENRNKVPEILQFEIKITKGKYTKLIIFKIKNIAKNLIIFW